MRAAAFEANSPYNVDPEPDSDAYFAPARSSAFLPSLSSGYSGKTTCSKSFLIPARTSSRSGFSARPLPTQEHRSNSRSATPTALGQAHPFYRMISAWSMQGQPLAVPPGEARPHFVPANLLLCDPTPRTPLPSKLPPPASPPRMPSPANPPTHKPVHRAPPPIPSRPPETTANPIPLPRQFAAAPQQPSFSSEPSPAPAARLPHSMKLRPALPAPATASQSRSPHALCPQSLHRFFHHPIAGVRFVSRNARVFAPDLDPTSSPHADPNHIMQPDCLIYRQQLMKPIIPAPRQCAVQD